MVPKTAAAEAGSGASAVTRWVVFRCGEQRFGVPLAQVNEIVPPLPFTRLPGVGADVCGLVGVRGRVITVFDLGVVLGESAAAGVPDHRLLLLELGELRVGGAVDEVREIAAATLDRMESEMGPGEAAQAAIGMGRGEDGPFIALDPIRLLRHRLQTPG
jgi:purine-binding chemotaxis protein CheW